ncbi:MAG TPA: hypothetical protein PK636_07125 [bacterium]|nr:hypothetical protein [bacterium]HPJ72439.1 hypothetical protein [bacterium]HPQ67015.1 hypothetical protein [bacterium]
MNHRAVLLTLLGLALPAAVSANPPRSIELSVKGKVLEVTVDHPVSDPGSHYIDQILVKRNGKGVVRQFFATQSGDEQKVAYTIPSLKSGDVIQVQATCCRGGELVQSLTVP